MYLEHYINIFTSYKHYELRSKNKKLKSLVISKPKKWDSYKIPVINLTKENLDIELLKYGLHHVISIKKPVKRNVAVELKSLSIILDKYIKPSSKENFHEYLRASTNIIIKNIYNDNDHTFKSLTNLRKNENIIFISADNESWKVNLNKVDYIDKINKMIDEEIANGKCIGTSDTTHVDLKRFQDFLLQKLQR